MTEKENTVGQVYLKNVRLSHPKLRNPSASVEGGKEKFRASFIIDPSTPEGKENAKRAKAAMMAVSKLAWPKAEKPPVKPDRLALKKGDNILKGDGTPKEEYQGMIVLSANSDDRPLLVYRNRKPIPEVEINRILYGGCRVEAVVRFYAITDPKKGGNGLFAGLEAVRFWGDDESFGRAGVSADIFDEAGDDDDDDEDHLTDDEEDMEDVI